MAALLVLTGAGIGGAAQAAAANPSAPFSCPALTPPPGWTAQPAYTPSIATAGGRNTAYCEWTDQPNPPPTPPVSLRVVVAIDAEWITADVPGTNAVGCGVSLFQPSAQQPWTQVLADSTQAEVAYYVLNPGFDQASVAAAAHQILATISPLALACPPAGAAETPAASAEPGGASSESGIPIVPLLAVGALVLVLIGGYWVWQRNRDAAATTACEELAARYRTMVQSRVRRAAGLAQGVAALGRASAAEQDATTARADLARDRAEAAGLLGSAGAIGTAAIGTYAASVSGAASALRSAVAFAGEGGEALLDYLPVLQGGAAPSLGLGTTIMNAIANLEADAQALVGLSAAPGAASVASVADVLQHGLERVDAAMAAASETRQRLEAACRQSRRDLEELDSEIGAALAQLATCPGNLGELPPDPRTTLPSLPNEPGLPPRG